MSENNALVNVRCPKTLVVPHERAFRKSVMICSDMDFVKELVGLPICLEWSIFAGTEEDLVKSVVEIDPVMVVVVSNGGPTISSQKICEAIRRQLNSPTVFVNRGHYSDDHDFSQFSDVDVREPRDRRDMLNLGIEIMRLAYDVPTPVVQVGLASAARRRTVRWILTAGALVAGLSGIITLVMQNEVEVAIQTAVTTFSAITSVEIGALVRNYIRHRQVS